MEWLKYDIAFYMFSVWLTSAGFIFPLVPIYLSLSGGEGFNKGRVAVYSLASLFVAFLSVTLAPRNIAWGYRQAFHRLETELALVEAETDPKAANIRLANALKDGETYIAQAIYSSFFSRVTELERSVPVRAASGEPAADEGNGGANRESDPI